MRILLVEDDTIMSKSLQLVLKAEGYTCDAVTVGEDGIAIGKLYEYDAILLDLMLPDIDGLQVLKQLRDADISTPILMLSGVDEPDWRIQGFGLGADDFLAKPFDKRELVARIEAIVRRSKGPATERRVTGKGHLTELSERTGPRF